MPSETRRALRAALETLAVKDERQGLILATPTWNLEHRQSCESPSISAPLGLLHSSTSKNVF